MTSSYWLDEEWPPVGSNRVPGRIDVAVVGGGVTGCACALALAEAGCRIPLYEAREIAGGASGRNGGFAPRRRAGVRRGSRQPRSGTGSGALASDRGLHRPACRAGR